MFTHWSVLAKVFHPHPCHPQRTQKFTSHNGGDYNATSWRRTSCRLPVRTVSKPMTKANHPRSKTETRRLLEEWPAKLELAIVVLYSRRQCPGIPSRLFLLLFLDNFGIGAAEPRRPSEAVRAAALEMATLFAYYLARLVSIPFIVDCYLVLALLSFPYVFLGL
jgi:hypothetical protein